MITLREGEKQDIAIKIERTRGTADFSLTTPERRILDSARALVTGYDWGAGTWDDTNKELYARFDSTAAGLAAPGTYYVQIRGVIGTERYAHEVLVKVVEWGP